MPDRAQLIEIYAPTLGRKHDAPTTIIDHRAMPDGTNGKMYYGANQKEYGTTLFSTGALSAPISGIFDAKFPGGSILQVFTHTGVYRHSSTADAFVADGQTFLGTFTDFWNGLVHNNVFVYTNGSDPIQYKPSYGATGTVMNSAITVDTYKSWALGSIRDHLVLYHTVENGTEYHKRVRWTKSGVLTFVGTADFGTGTAGAIDLQDIEGEIKTAVPLGITYAIYGDRSVHIQNWVGGEEIYQFTKTLSNIGTPSRRGVVSVGDVNYFIGQDSFYAYYGGDDLRDIAESVRDHIFSEINRPQMQYSFVEYDEVDNEVIFHIPTGGSTQPNVAWVYRLENKSWSKQMRDYTASGRTTRFSGTTWGDMSGNWGSPTSKWGDYYLNEGATISLYGDQSGRVVKKDKTVNTLSYSGTTTNQAYTYVTPDLIGFQVEDPYDKSKIQYTMDNHRWLGVSVEATGTGSLLVEYSTNKGSTYVAYPQSPLTVTPSGTTHTLQVDYTAPYTRLRFSHTGSGSIGITYVALDFVPGTDQ